MMKHTKAINILSALAQETRLSIFLLLLASGEGGLAAGDISERLEIPSTTLSFHLSQLKSVKLVSSEKDGRSIIYCANKKQAKKVANYITGKQ